MGSGNLGNTVLAVMVLAALAHAKPDNDTQKETEPYIKLSFQFRPPFCSLLPPSPPNVVSLCGGKKCLSKSDFEEGIDS